MRIEYIARTISLLPFPVPLGTSLFHCLLSPEIFNSYFYGTDASYIQTLSPKRSFSESRIHGGHPSNFSNFDGTPPKKDIKCLDKVQHRATKLVK